MSNYTFPLHLNLLVAEDEISSSLYLKTILNKYVSGKIIMAKDGKAAWDYFQNNRDEIDVVLSDITMPNLDGLELAKLIRKQDKKIPIVFTTALDNNYILKQSIELGIYQYIIKPIQSQNIEQILLDIYDRKIKELQFNHQYEYNKILSRALEESISMIAILDNNNTVQFINRSFRDFLKTTPDKFVGKKLIEFAFDSHNPDEFQRFIDAIENHQNYSGEILFITSLGEPFWGSITHTPFFNEKNEYIYAIDIIEDITSKKLSQENLRKSKEMLESIVEKRTEELIILNNQLKQEIEKRIKYELELSEAKNYAEKANEAKSVFLAKVSHELRTPMNGILGIASIMKDLKLDTKAKKFVDIIYSSAENLLSIINDLLDFSKIKSGRFSLNLHTFDFNEDMTHTIELLKPLAENKSIEIIYNIDENIPKTLYGDNERIKQVFWNILSNAIKFTKEGFVNVQIKLNKIINNKAEIEFIVQDTGIGIPDNKKSIIFDSFMQLEPLMTRNYGGTGLGLSISKEIIDLMYGNIYFESKLGKGTTFYFTLLIDIKEPTSDLRDKLSDEKIEFASDNTNLNHFLIFESDNETRNTLENLLADTHINLFFADNSMEVLDIFSINPTDAIFISTEIEKENIINTVNKIRRIEIDLKKHIPIILIHNAFEPINKDEFNSVGIDFFLEKPLKTKNLTELLNEISTNNTKHIVQIDIEELMKSNSKEVMQKIIDYFIQNYEPILSKLEQAIKEYNYRKIYEYSSQLRSQIGNFGVFRSVQLATRIAKKALENNAENMIVLFNALKWEIDQIVNYLNNTKIEKIKEQ